MSTTESRGDGLRWVLLATVIAGALGYVIQLLAPVLLVDEAAYVTFSVLWSTVYLCVSGMSGVQQEVTRAAHPSTSHAPSTVLRDFTLLAAGCIAIIALVLGGILSIATVPIHGLLLAAALVTALVGYLLVVVLSGVLYGLSLWRAVAGLTIVDAVLRAAMLTLAFSLQWPTTVIAFSIALPFGLAFLIVWVAIRRRVVGHFTLDVRLAPLSRNVLSTVGAATCMGAMISGLPLLIGVTAAGESPAAVGAIVLAITLSRAPIVTPIIALQSFLISAVFRGRALPERGAVLKMLLTAALGIIALAGVAAVVGPPIIEFVSAGRFAIDAALMGVIVISAGLVAVMCISGPALVSAKRHTGNLLGWVSAATLTLVCLLLPLDLTTRVATSLIAPVIVGVAIHVASLLRAERPASATD